MSLSQLVHKLEAETPKSMGKRLPHLTQSEQARYDALASHLYDLQHCQAKTPERAKKWAEMAEATGFFGTMFSDLSERKREAERVGGREF
jgi:hypothetical protein